MGSPKPGKATLKQHKPITKTMKKARAYIHLFEPGWTESRGVCCGLSESNPIHDFREPPGIGEI